MDVPGEQRHADEAGCDAAPTQVRPPETVLAFDFGERHIGVAVGNSLSAGAEALEILRTDKGAIPFERIKSLLDAWHPARLVVGRPSHPDGAAHAMTARCERFARQLNGRFGLPVILVDERYSSVEARREQPTRGRRRIAPRVDAEAAAIILRQWWAEQGLS